jgi:hypothetical protein
MCERGEGGVDLAVVARLENAHLQAHCARRWFHRFQVPSGNLRVARIDQHG